MKKTFKQKTHKIPEHIMKEIQVRSGARFLLEFCGKKKKNISLACFSASCSIARFFMAIKDRNVVSVTRDVVPYSWFVWLRCEMF